MAKQLVYNFTELSQTFNHFLPYVLKTLEAEGVLKYGKDSGALRNESTPFTEKPKIDFDELKKYQVIFFNKEESFFSKAWRKCFTTHNGEEDGDTTYRMKIVKIITDEVYEED